MADLSTAEKLLDTEGQIESKYTPGQGIELWSGSRGKKLLIFPAMWNSGQIKQDQNLINIADTLLMEALPKDYEEVKSQC